MINADMRLYSFATLGSNNAYGQALPPKDNDFKGTIKMAINITNQGVQDNINYTNANYIGLTQATIDDTYFIKYGEETLKVLYVTPKGRFKQVFLSRV